jgi:hypothetical protein
MNTKKLLFYLLAVLLGGCVPVVSLHPLFTDEKLVFKEKLLGTWADDPNSPKVTWQFKRIAEPEKAYKLIFSDDKGKKGSFVARLVKLENSLFLDVYPAELPWEPEDPNNVKWLYNSFFLIPAHTFMKIDSIEPQLKMQLTDDDSMEELLKENPNAIKHTSVEDRLILTASTKELQGFVLKYADDDRVFIGEIVLNRKKSKGPNAPENVCP